MADSQFRDTLEQSALGRSVLCEALALALHPPTSETVAALTLETTAPAVMEAAVSVTAAADQNRSSREASLENSRLDLVGRAQAWTQELPSLNLEKLQGTHVRLFGHTAQGTVCPYETEYGQEGLFQQPQQLATLVGFYRAFGLRMRRAERERPDHISCELEFLGFLSKKQLYARAHSDSAMEEDTRKASRLFLKEHLGRFGRAFARSLSSHDCNGFLGRAGELLSDFLILECRRFGIDPGPPALPLRQDCGESVPMACSSQTELVQLEP